ncbi:ATP-binding protein [Streptomyces fagopyri]|uniref:ATP-binding protein n=1 Tax=Streptomyces fagopyri TaxID=2662397 RepID=A0A5Q0L650_9ACTN|nr:ATP-binding protein [Streptomyces fagopyri]QFZ72530.1 ATP-binding protein [Streptomyces fagopyri]
MRAAERRDITITDQNDALRRASLAARSTRPPASSESAAQAADAAEVTSPATARSHVGSLVRAQWRSADGMRQEAVVDLLLVVSELVTNAIRHGGGLAGFRATPTEEGVRLAVRDNSDVVPAGAFGLASIPEGYRPNGYGWPLIIRLAREVTVEPSPGGGKTIRVLVPLT